MKNILTSGTEITVKVFRGIYSISEIPVSSHAACTPWPSLGDFLVGECKKTKGNLGLGLHGVSK